MRVPTSEGVSPEDRAELERWLKSRSVTAKRKQRAHIVLRRAEGMPTQELMRRPKVTKPTLNPWR